MKRNIWSGFTPQIETNTKKSKAPRSTSIYFLTNCVRALGNSALVPILATKESVKRLRIKKTIIDTTVAIIKGYFWRAKSMIIG
jgi:hypothetical protein